MFCTRQKAPLVSSYSRNFEAQISLQTKSCKQRVANIEGLFKSERILNTFSMTKYNSLTNYLSGVPNERTLTWAELDQIVGGMPASAVNYRAWWSGDRPNVLSWKSAGFEFTNLHMGSRVTFVRNRSRTEVVAMSSQTTRAKSLPAEVNQDDTQRATANIDSDSWTEMKHPEKASERDGMSSLLEKVNQNMTASNRLESERFAYFGPIIVERDSSGLPVEYLPQSSYDNRNGLPLNRHGQGPFCRFDLPKLTEGPGVYAISIDDAVVYIGECQNFRDRYGPRGYGVIHPRNCFVGGQPTNCKVNARVLEATLRNSIPDLWFKAESVRSRKLVEAELVSLIQPKWNGHG